MPGSNLSLVFMHGTRVILRLAIDRMGEFTCDDLCHAANWIIQQLREEVPKAYRVGYIFDTDYFKGSMEKETPLTTNGIYALLHDCQLFNHHEVRFSVDEKPSEWKEPPNKRYIRQQLVENAIYNWFQEVEEKQRTFCRPNEQQFDEKDVSFSDFLRKLETRQKDIMKRFQSVSFSSSEGEEKKGIELGLEALTDDVFQPQMPCPDQEIFFDTSDCFGDEKEPLLSSYRPYEFDSNEIEEGESTLDRLLDELLGKVDSLGVKERNRRVVVEAEDFLCEEKKRVAEMTAELSKMEMEWHMERVAKEDPRAKLSMTVATSTDIRGKQDSVPRETQTDKDSGSEDEVAIINHALAVIQKKRRGMFSGVGKKSPELKSKFFRKSIHPVCITCSKEKKEAKEIKKKEKVAEEKKKSVKETKENANKNKKMVKAMEYSNPKDVKSYYKEKPAYMKKPFDLMEELEKSLPTSSEQAQIDEPFNRKLREKWAHDGMKSLKKSTPIHSVRFPQGKLPNRFHRLQALSGFDLNQYQNDDQLDKYNLARLDGKIYKLIPRFSGNTTPLNKNYGPQSTVPASIHMAIMDESDPWLNWENHYYKVYRALNVGSKTLKGLRVDIIHASNIEIARNLSKIPENVPMDFTVDFELLFNLIDREKEGMCVMQLKNDEGDIVSPAFVFLGKKLDRPFTQSKPAPEIEAQSKGMLLLEAEHRFNQSLEEPKPEEIESEIEIVESEKEEEEENDGFEQVDSEKEDQEGSDFELVSMLNEID